MKPESKLYNLLCEICERNGIGVAAKSWGMESGYFGSTGLEDYASDVDALALVNGSTDGKVRNRLIFLGDNLSGFREAYVFAHEIGHCVLG